MRQDSFELKTSSGEDTGENIVVGGENKWAYDSFVNWEFFPKGWIDQPQGPILVYFKETQTPQEEWDVGPGQQANSPEALAAGAKRGQVRKRKRKTREVNEMLYCVAFERDLRRDHL